MDKYENFIKNNPFNQLLNIQTIPSPLGDLLAISDESSLLLLQFADHWDKRVLMEAVSNHSTMEIIEKTDTVLELFQVQMGQYFNGMLKDFTIPLRMNGSAFQQAVWHYLQNIPYGKTVNYTQEALALGDLKSIRAIATANAQNPIMIVVPCHRVIGKNGQLNGYAGGLVRKRQLLELEGAWAIQHSLF